MAQGKCGCVENKMPTTRKRYDEPMSAEDMADDFALYGLKKRAAALENLDSELGGEIGSGAHALRHHARLIGLRQKMTDMHEALRRAKR